MVGSLIKKFEPTMDGAYRKVTLSFTTAGGAWQTSLTGVTPKTQDPLSEGPFQVGPSDWPDMLTAVPNAQPVVDGLNFRKQSDLEYCMDLTYGLAQGRQVLMYERFHLTPSLQQNAVQLEDDGLVIRQTIPGHFELLLQWIYELYYSRIPIYCPTDQGLLRIPVNPKGWQI